LRKFRDGVLEKNLIGRLIIKIYYFLSVEILKRMGKYKFFNVIIKKVLDLFLKLIR
jgi:hypothetical protein